MNSVTIPTQPVRANLTTETLWDRVRTAISTIWQKISLRFGEASQAFLQRLEWECQSPAAGETAASRSMTLAGYLFPLEGGTPLPIFEGINRCIVTEKGAVRLVPGSSPNPGSENLLRLERNILQFSDKNSEGKWVTLQTNDKFQMGSQELFVKIFPEGYRVKTQYSIPKMIEEVSQ